jgi:hypothetical protein
MKLLLTAAAGILLLSTTVQAQTISIINGNRAQEAAFVEAGLKRHLRAEGYTVKGGTTEGFIILLQAMNLERGERRGVVGSVTIGSFDWQKYADELVSEQCKDEHAIVQNIKEVFGTRIIHIDSTLAVAGDEEGLSEMLSTWANSVIRVAAKKTQTFFGAVENHAKDTEPKPSTIPSY